MVCVHLICRKVIIKMFRRKPVLLCATGCMILSLAICGCNKHSKKADTLGTTKTTANDLETKSSIELIESDSVGMSGSRFSADTINKCDYTEKVVSYIEPSVYIYKIKDTQSEPAGIMFPGNEAKIVEIEDEWTYISFGDNYGYVRNDSVLYGEEAYVIAVARGVRTDVFKADNICVYENASEESEVKALAGKDTMFAILEDKDDFYHVTYGSVDGYVKADTIKETFILTEAMSIEEYNAMVLAIKEEEARKQAEIEARMRENAVAAGRENYIPTTNETPMGLSDDELWLLACIVKYESGWQEYEGKLAVANVVLNRYRMGAGSIAAVIYARNQFSGVSDGAGGPSEYFANNYLNQELNYRLPQNHADECMKAAIEAASGINNIGDYRFFIGVDYAEYSRYSSYKIIGGHCFYNY